MAAQAPDVEIGSKALDFSLMNVDGHPRRLADVAGKNGTVIAFICNHCPYVKAVAGRLVRDAVELSNHGINVVAINSNDAMAYPEDSFEKMKTFAEGFGLTFPYLHDESQQVAKSYGAVCTPDFFGFDGDLRLQYRGRLDASGKEAGPIDSKRELFEAMLMVSQTGKGPAAQLPAIGCSIKWREAA